MTDPKTFKGGDLAARRAADPYGEGALAARARKMRSLAIAGGLILFVVLIFVVSILRLSANMHHG
ncbi:hypothetical protein BH09PSE2_BH09PSE2_06800 [soil metagenome]